MTFDKIIFKREVDTNVRTITVILLQMTTI